jgi:protein-tyrosine-phosphatase
MNDMKKVHVHFVCTGNAYRSRLAEVYLLSKKLPNVTASSSGVRALKHREHNGPISWYALRLLAKHNLVSHLPKFSPTNTTKKNLNIADLVIFMRDQHYQIATAEHEFNGKYEVWNILDINDTDIIYDLSSEENERKVLRLTEKTFDQIKKRVDELVEKISK